MGYSVDVRQKALAALRKGRTKKEINEIFGLGINTLRSWEKLEDETGSLEHRPLDRKPTKIENEKLLKYCEENPFATNVEAAGHFGCTEAGIRKAKKRLGITRKKKQKNMQSATKGKGQNLSKR